MYLNIDKVHVRSKKIFHCIDMLHDQEFFCDNGIPLENILFYD